MAKREIVTLGGGCFWCLEAAYSALQGVRDVQSGYMGGHVVSPTYREVCSGSTGHVEVVQIEFVPGEISFGEILDAFFSVHDPTTQDRQGNDVGSQYRSVIFHHSDDQKALAEGKIRELESARVWNNPIVTEIRPASTFYRAEDYHQGYFRSNSQEPYCQFVVRPKVVKFHSKFKDKLKKIA